MRNNANDEISDLIQGREVAFWIRWAGYTFWPLSPNERMQRFVVILLEREVEGSLKSPCLTGSVYGPESRIV